MPRLDLILLPLLGGYIFLITFNYTRFYHQRIEKNKLIYNSLLVAIILTGFVYLIDYFIFKHNPYSLYIGGLETNSVSYYRNYLSLKIDDILNFNKVGFKHSIIVLVISYPLALSLNRIKYFREEFSFDYTLSKWGTEFDKIIWNALGEKDDLEKLLMLTTKTNKVYIGQITKQSEPIGNTYIRVIPSLSGFRDKDDHTLTITTSYTDMIEYFTDKGLSEEIDNKLGVIIPTSEIILISRFDIKVFGRIKTNEE
ncbi:hypothetical protein LB467_15910 [Salegentibacter sp. JZCK2]|uniref:hypothetical protein n=1 Tax=Salegentibacter tibetensis TaxID=2873600 RepID=UPI001CCF7035|nr:hypothetical protein [Salegentibacter tibetensis]MBZ9731180.1 hypothetical protein [Salegentibacter tibetensis]